jgi:hypothetical protein
MALIACGARNPAVARAVSRARADCTPPPRRRGFREVVVHSCASFRHEKNCECRMKTTIGPERRTGRDVFFCERATIDVVVSLRVRTSVLVRVALPWY